jgi:serine protease Do
VVGEMPDEARTAQRSQRRGPGGKPPAESVSKLGMTLSEPTAEQRKELKITGGILVEDVQGAAARAGIRRGDIILAVNNQDVKSLEQFGQLMTQFEKGKIVAMLVRRGGNSLYVPFRIE